MPDIIVSGLTAFGERDHVALLYLREEMQECLQVLAEAGGLPSTPFVREGTLTRWYPDGRNVRVRLICYGWSPVRTRTSCSRRVTFFG